MSDPWKEVASRLLQRDKIEKAESEYYNAFSQLARLRVTTADANLDRLVKENCDIREENEILVSRLNGQTIKLDSAKLDIGKLNDTVKSQDSKIAKLQKKISQLTQELAEKNRLFDLLNDEHLIAQIQLNVLKQNSQKEN